MPRALVLVDIQRDYFPGGKLPLHEPEAAAEKAGQVLEAFRASGEPVVEKRSPNSFKDTDLEAQLRDQGVDEVVVVGMMTSMCVDATTRAGSDLGFKMTVVQDACATPDLEHEGRAVAAPDVQAAFLAALGQFYADVVPASALTAK